MKVLIIEDEPNQLKYIVKLIEKYLQQVKVIETADSIAQSVEKIKYFKPDVLLADIQIKDGLSFEIFKEIPAEFEVIFITAFEKFRVEAMRHFAFHFLLKPIFPKDLIEAFDALRSVSSKKDSHNTIEKGFDFIKGLSDTIVLHSQGETNFVSAAKIIKCEASGSYTNLFLDDGKIHLVSKNLKHYEVLLKVHNFVRVSRFAIVNTNYIEKIIGDKELILRNGDRLSLSKMGKINIKAALS
ncbi:LytR/AlgR family response regulator transcription factor [Spongiivirga citrea]|uniref:Response regulator n=1 Tax=Spongiivirga citrea TaxID=1481457 RepID=A0A6M0CIL1_9FLAO|nr:LytTR family DNA-binding domain-containing protein [Spongiivirga citrea]NER16783.1 response regulator [Spongiivirga citrea]